MIMDFKLNVMTLNVTGLSSVVKRKHTARMIKQQHVTLFSLQETHMMPSEAKYMNQIFQGYMYHDSTSSNSRGVFVGISRKETWVLAQKIIDKEGRFAILQDL